MPTMKEQGAGAAAAICVLPLQTCFTVLLGSDSACNLLQLSTLGKLCQGGKPFHMPAT